MFKINIPGFGDLTLEHVIFDFNGTLSVSGRLISNVAPRLVNLANKLQLHVVTGDSFGSAKSELEGIDCKLAILPPENQGIAKENYLEKLNPMKTITIGNGRNDSYMLKKACIGIVIIGEEGAAIEAIEAANIAVPTIFSALDLLDEPRKLIATLRS